MAIQIISTQAAYLDGYDLQSRINAVALKYGCDLLDATTLGNATHLRLGGLKNVAVQINGYINPDATDLAQFTDIGVKDTPMTIGASGDAIGSIAYFFNALNGDINLGGKVGAMHAFQAGAEASSSQLVRGTVMLNSRAAALTASGYGTSRQLGAVAAGQSVYAALHVWQVGTGSITAKLCSNSTNSFSGGETDRVTFTAATTVGGQFKSTAGAITDTWWNTHYIISGGAPSFLAILTAGIQ